MKPSKWSHDVRINTKLISIWKKVPFCKERKRRSFRIWRTSFLWEERTKNTALVSKNLSHSFGDCEESFPIIFDKNKFCAAVSLKQEEEKIRVLFYASSNFKEREKRTNDCLKRVISSLVTREKDFTFSRIGNNHLLIRIWGVGNWELWNNKHFKWRWKGPKTSQ
jgi:hypothetical protein